MKKYALIFFAALILTLSACTRAASTAPIGTPTPDANFPQPVATTSMNAIELAGTQTAIATAGGMPMPATGTAVVVGTQSQAPAGEPTYTPLAGIDTNPVLSTPMPTVTAQAPATIIPASQSSGQVSNPGTYTLHEGEYPYCLARRFNVNPDLLLSQNGLNSSQSYYVPGTKITIPQSGGGFPGNRARLAHPAQYVVRSGDTIYSISCVFGDVDPLGIASANNLTGSYSLTTGSTIQIP